MYNWFNMMLPGQISKSGPYYATLLECLGAYGQGRTRKAACDALAAEVLEYAADTAPLAGFEVTVTDDGDVTCYVTSNDPVRLLSLLLRRQRELNDMSLADVATEMGAKSRNSWAQYEQGRVDPSMTKLGELLAVVAPELTLAVIPRSARVIPRWDDEADDEAEMDAVIATPTPDNIAALRAKLAKAAPKRKARAAR